MENPHHSRIVKALEAYEDACQEGARNLMDIRDEKLDQVVRAALQAEFPSVRLPSLSWRVNWREGDRRLDFWYDTANHRYCVDALGASTASSTESWTDALASQPEVEAYQTFLRVANMPPWQCLYLTDKGGLVWLQQEPVTSLLPLAREALTAAYAWDRLSSDERMITLVLPPGCGRLTFADELNEMSDLNIFVTERWEWVEWDDPGVLTGIASI